MFHWVHRDSVGGIPLNGNQEHETWERVSLRGWRASGALIFGGLLDRKGLA
jgi:hypothetical protein